jgi:hypothetical protein
MLIQTNDPPVSPTNVPGLGARLIALSLMLCTALSGACSSPTSPTRLEPPPGAYRSTFTVVKGEAGFAGISITPKAIPEGTMAADISVRLAGLRRNATYLLQRAQEGVGGRPLGSDGICQRGLGLSPWSPNDPPTLNFQTMPLPATGPLVTITTTSTGDGTVDFEFRAAMVLAGTTNDVMFRLVDDAEAPTTELRSDCMTIAAR